MPAPTPTEALAWVNADGSNHDLATVTAALATETANQAHRCTQPAEEDDWPVDLAEALLRRVQRNLVTKPLPLGVANDYEREIARLESAHRIVGGLVG